MDWSGEALPYGLPATFGWQLHSWIATSIPGGRDPGDAPDVFPWFVIFASGGPSPATNTRVQVRNIYIYWLSKKTKSWNLATGSNTTDGYYNSFNTDTNYFDIQVNARNEPQANGGGTSIKMLAGGYPFQGWCATGIGGIDPTDVAGIWVYCEARLILDDPAGTDDRSTAGLVLCSGGDYKDTNANTIAGIGIGRFKRVTNNWRAFNMSTLTDAQWSKSAPPPVNISD
jgi:hypothetical protein